MKHGASHIKKSRKTTLVFKNKEEWRKSAIKEENTGLKPIQVLRQKGKKSYSMV